MAFGLFLLFQLSNYRGRTFVVPGQRILDDGERKRYNLPRLTAKKAEDPANAVVISICGILTIKSK